MWNNLQPRNKVSVNYRVYPRRTDFISPSTWGTSSYDLRACLNRPSTPVTLTCLKNQRKNSWPLLTTEPDRYTREYGLLQWNED